MKSCVVLSSYNGERYIVEQLDSIKNQTRKVDSVFLSDDSSKDSTVKIIKEYIFNNNLSNWHLKINEKNLGWKVNFANLILNVPQEYDVIFLCDQDDIWKLDKVLDMMNIFENDPSTGLLISNAEIKFQDKEANYVKFDRILTNNNYVLTTENNTHLKRPGCAFAVRRDLAQDCFKNYSKSNFSHDGILWLYFYCINNIKVLDKETFIFRRLASSSTYLDKKSNRLLHKKNESIERIEMLESVKNISSITQKAKHHIDNAIKLETIRQSFFINKSFFLWIKCLKYIKYYPNIKQWFGDLYFSLTFK